MAEHLISRRDAVLMAGAIFAARAKSAPDWRIPVLVYHRFAAVVTDSMTVRTASFENQLGVIRKQSLRVTPLGDTIADLSKPGGPRDTKVVAITADDGHRSVYSVMWPILLQAHLPFTLFIYPSAISHASYALTWAQLREMRQSGLAAIGSHTFWHPNFRQEKKRLSPEAYRKFVQFQLVRSKQVLEQELSTRIDWLAWPFGIYDDELIRMAEDAGYTAGFTIERRLASPADRRMAIPRFLMTDVDVGARFARLIGCP